MICSVCGGVGLAKGLCQKHYNDAWRIKNRQKGCEKSLKWRKKNHTKALAATAAWRKDNPQWEAEYRAKNTEAHLAKSLRWAKAHPERVNARNARRRAKQLKAMPGWANNFFIEEIYDLARRRTELKSGGVKEWHVDHIVPLQHPLVCGLHVEHNLQVIPAVDNIKKKNRWWPQMPRQIVDERTAA